MTMANKISNRAAVFCPRTTRKTTTGIRSRRTELRMLGISRNSRAWILIFGMYYQWIKCESQGVFAYEQEVARPAGGTHDWVESAETLRSTGSRDVKPDEHTLTIEGKNRLTMGQYSDTY